VTDGRTPAEQRPRLRIASCGKNVGNAEAPTPWDKVWLTLQKYAPPLVCHHAKLGRSMSNVKRCTYVRRSERKMDPSRPPVKVTGADTAFYDFLSVIHIVTMSLSGTVSETNSEAISSKTAIFPSPCIYRPRCRGSAWNSETALVIKKN